MSLYESQVYKHGVKLLVMNMGWKFKSACYVYDLVYSSVLADGYTGLL